MVDRRARLRPKSGARHLYYSGGGSGGESVPAIRTYQNSPLFSSGLGDINSLFGWDPTKPLANLAPNAPNLANNAILNGLANVTGATATNAAQTVTNAVNQVIGDGVLSSRNLGGGSFGGGRGSRTTAGGNILQPLAATNGMVFPYTPDSLSYSQQIDYNTYDPVHSNQEFLSYARTKAPNISLVGTFTVQNQQEALYSLACVHFLRAVSKMSFGRSKNPGTPPPVLLFSAYGEYMFNDLPVILQGFTVDFGNQVDYVQVPNSNTYIPTMFNISLQLIVQHTPNEVTNFNLEEFRSGKLMKNGGWL